MSGLGEHRIIVSEEVSFVAGHGRIEPKPTYICLDCGAVGNAGGYHDHGNGNAGDTARIADLLKMVRDAGAALDEAAEARHDYETMMAERNLIQGELDNIAALVGVGPDRPYGEVQAAFRRQREALREALDAMVHRPVDSELFLSAIAHAAAALGRTEEPEE